MKIGLPQRAVRSSLLTLPYLQGGLSVAVLAQTNATLKFNVVFVYANMEEAFPAPLTRRNPSWAKRLCNLFDWEGFLLVKEVTQLLLPQGIPLRQRGYITSFPGRDSSWPQRSVTSLPPPRQRGDRPLSLGRIPPRRELRL